MKRMVGLILVMVLLSACVLVCPTSAFADSNIRYELERVREDFEQYGIVKAYAGESCIWTYVTETTPRTELETISDLSVYGSTVYLVVNGTLIALNGENGREKWRRDDVGAGNSFVIDYNGTIYVSGFYGPNLVVFSPNGTELYREDNDDYYWVYDLEIRGNTLYIYYDSVTNGVKTMDISQFQGSTGIKIFLGNQELTFDQSPVIVKDRILVPIRAIFEAMGYTVHWNGRTQTAESVKGNDVITIKINQPWISYKVNGTTGSYQCDVAPQIVSDRTMVPLRAVSESAGCVVAWDGIAKTVRITYDK